MCKNNNFNEQLKKPKCVLATAVALYSYLNYIYNICEQNQKQRQSIHQLGMYCNSSQNKTLHCRLRADKFLITKVQNIVHPRSP